MTDENTLKLAKASYNENGIVSVSPNWLGGAMIDKLQVTDDYNDQVNLCRFYARKDPIAAGVISKQIALGFNSYKPKRGNCTDEEYDIYSSINDMILSFMKVAAEEYLISGLVVPAITWKSSTGKELGLKGRPNKTYLMPDSVWMRNFDSITLKKTPVPTKVRIYTKIPPEDIAFIQSGGVYTDGTKDRELYLSIKKNYPEYFQALLDGQKEIYLPDAMAVRRDVRPGDIWPTPYLLPALESLNHKRNLKKMDYAIAARVISAIQVITMGNDKYPLTEDDQEVLDELKTQMLWRGTYNNIERLFQLFANHTLHIEWVFPPTDALLDDKKYTQVNHDILYALGVPAIITTGEAQRSGASTAEFALLPPTEMMKSLREDLTPLIKYVYSEVQDKNNFNNVAIPAFGPIKLYDPAKAAASGEIYYNGGIISPETWADVGGFDYENEQVLREKNNKLKESLGLNDTPVVPFSSPNLNNPETNPTQNKQNKQSKPKLKQN